MELNEGQLQGLVKQHSAAATAGMLIQRACHSATCVSPYAYMGIIKVSCCNLHMVTVHP